MTGGTPGYDFLGSLHPRFNARAAVKYTPKGSSFGGLDITFGTDLSNLRTLLTGIRPKYYRFDIWNTTCVRNRNCGKYEHVCGESVSSLDAKVRARDKKLLTKFESRVEIYRQLSKEFRQTDFLLSPALEHDLSFKAWCVLADAALSIWPHVQLVNSAHGPIQPPYRGSWEEEHTSPDAPYRATHSPIVSSDGTDLRFDANYEMWNKATATAFIRFAWMGLYNGRVKGPFIDPRRRKDFPTPEEFRDFVRLVS